MITEQILAECKSFDPQIWSDLHKDAYGFRPRFSLDTYTAQELDDLWERTCDDLENEMKNEKERQAVALKAFNDRLNNMVEQFKICNKTAFRWMLQADDIDQEYIDFYGYSYVCYEYGLAYSEAEYLKSLTE